MYEEEERGFPIGSHVAPEGPDNMLAFQQFNFSHDVMEISGSLDEFDE